ncbi:MAG: Rpn family recombination-promoting nuclease/putative transposase [Methylococcales bacterium]
MQPIDYKVVLSHKRDQIQIPSQGIIVKDDIIWRIQYGQEWIYVYLLLEFQSSVDHFMAVRISGYLALLYQDLIRSQKLVFLRLYTLRATKESLRLPETALRVNVYPDSDCRIT